MADADSRGLPFDHLTMDFLGRDGMESLLDAVPGFVFVKDTTNQILAVNTAVADTLGTTPVAMSGTQSEYWYPEVADKFYRDDLQVFRSGTAMKGIIEEKRSPFGETRLIETDKYPVRSPSGRIEGLVVIAQDVTAPRYQQQLEEVTDKLAALWTTAGRTIHDMNGCLAAIVGNLELAERTTQLEVSRESLAAAKDAAYRAATLTQNLLRLARGQAITIRESAFDVNEVVSRAISLMRPLLSQKLRTEVQLTNATLVAHGDSEAILDVATNLIRNAVEAMPDGGRLLVRSDLPRSKAHVAFSVEDTGAGIPEYAKPRIFQPLFTTKKDGVGLGLASVDAIVRAHRGTVEFVSAPGSGTKFRVILPRHEGPQPPGSNRDPGD